MYERSLLTLRALTDARTGAVAAGARDGWAYVWPRDAGAAALAFAAAGYRRRGPARRRLPRRPGPRRGGPLRRRRRARSRPRPPRATPPAGSPPPPRGRRPPATSPMPRLARPSPTTRRAPGRLPRQRDRLAGGAGERTTRRRFLTPRGTRARGPATRGSGLDSAAAWAVRPFPRPALCPARRDGPSVRLAAQPDAATGSPLAQAGRRRRSWSAPTAWSAWSLAALAGRERRPGSRAAIAAALRLLGDLRRAATPAGDAARAGRRRRPASPRSTTPLAWSHAFAILALRSSGRAP